ncbi:MAG: SDR family NAD(P)-dependent oxidoreductase [Bacteroidetes bacterium]|nr:SDR family NAD(P)-dependent oxidoreductase [Bacteroidota bacterium]
MNKKIVITGATKGIGRAIAEKFGSEGWDLAVCARSQRDLDEMNSSLVLRSSRLVTFVCDVSKPKEVKAFAEKILNEFGAVEIIVNNAGVFIPGQVINEKEGTLEKLMETNLYSAYYLSRMLLPKMLEKRSGHIFNLCSVASIQAYPNGGSYSISKFALLGLSKALREELKEYHIKVTALIAGATYTDSWSQSNLPESRFMKAEDIAQAVWDVYHLSENTVVEEILLRPMQGDI